MRLAVDALAVRTGSAAITLENLLAGWHELAPQDEVVVLSESHEVPFQLPPGARVERVPRPPLPGTLAGLWLRSVGVRRASARLKADGLLSGVTASAFLGAACPHGVILYDLRHEFRPEQFSFGRRWARRLSYAWSFWSADGIYCISRRTRDDLLRTRSRLRGKAVLARYGADHVDRWTGPSPEPRAPARGYALAFGQFANKNVNAVLDAWRLYCADHDDLDLRLVGMGGKDRDEATKRVAELGIADRVDLMPWLDDAEFVACFRAASLVLFPSDFEGFGLPAVEALRLGIPLVVSEDPALAEVTGGHAAIAPGSTPEVIAAAIERALAASEEDRRAGRDHTEQFKWRYMAEAIRNDLRRGPVDGRVTASAHRRP